MSTNNGITCKEGLQRLCVYGFIRMYCITCEMPDVLKDLCFAMYLIVFDEWSIEKSHPDLEININKTIVKVPSGDESWKNAVGDLIIQRGDIQQWKFRLIGETDDQKVRCTLIGILNIKHISSLQKQSDAYFCDAEFEGFAFYTLNGDIFRGLNGRTSYAVGLCKDDILTMMLDMKNINDKKCGSLSFKINDKDKGIAVDWIDVDEQYCMAVGCIDQREEIELIIDEK